MMKKIFLLAIFFISLSSLFAQSKTGNIIIVTLDGFRWEEVFGGADSLLISDSTYVHDTASLKQQFWTSSIEERRKKLLPFFWNTVQSQGQLYGNRWKENKVNNANKYWFSYPGYNEIFTGRSTTSFGRGKTIIKSNGRNAAACFQFFTLAVAFQSMSSSKKTRIVVIGIGAVGSTTAYTLLLRSRMDELVLIDSNNAKAIGDALDMNHGLPLLGKAKVWAGDYEDCRDADIIIITAGVPQRPGESRIDLLKRNVTIFEGITDEVLRYNKDGILLIASNPVDVMSYFTWKKSGWPVHRVIGSGTLLDSSRLRYLIGNKLNIDSRSVHAHIIGEHGDSELAVWSLANIAGSEISLSDEEKHEIFVNTRDAAYKIIEAKGATYYAIALALDRICTAILKNEASVLNVSTLLTNYHGVSDVYLGVPCIVDRNGVREVLQLQINEDEKNLLRKSADKLKELIRSISM